MSAKAIASALFALLLGATSVFLWNAHGLSVAQQAAGAAAIVAGLWAVGRLTTPGARGPGLRVRGGTGNARRR